MCSVSSPTLKKKQYVFERKFLVITNAVGIGSVLAVYLFTCLPYGNVYELPARQE